MISNLKSQVKAFTKRGLHQLVPLIFNIHFFKNHFLKQTLMEILATGPTMVAFFYLVKFVYRADSFDYYI